MSDEVTVEQQLRQAEVDSAYWRGRAEALEAAIMGQPNLTAPQNPAPAPGPGFSLDLPKIMELVNKLAANKPRTDG